jgi:hypothetical protein
MFAGNCGVVTVLISGSFGNVYIVVGVVKNVEGIIRY